MDSSIEYKIQRLNLLAFPRNSIPKCELTGERANVELVTQHITLYYATEELAEQAWLGIIKKIAHLLPPLTQPAPIVGTQEERQKRVNNMNVSKRSLIDFCLLESLNMLSAQKYQLSFPAAYQALKFCKDIDGDKAISLVEPYMQLSQSCLGLKQFSKAEEYLSLARWIVLNTPTCSDKIKTRLHMLKGRVAISQGNHDESKKDFAHSIYYSSRCYGAESIVSSIGYYRLGDAFLAQGNVECSLAFFDKVVDIWYKYLSELNQSTAKISDGGEGGGEVPATARGNDIIRNDEQLTEENVSEGRAQLELIFEHRRRLLGNGHIATGEVQYTLGLFEFFLLGNDVKAEAFILSAVNAYEMQLGPTHPSTKHVHMLVQLVQQSISDKAGATAKPIEFN